VLRRFGCRCGLYKVLAAVVYKKSTYQRSVSFYICDLNLEVIEKFQANKTVRLVVFHTGKVCTIRPWKFPEILTGIFGRMGNAPCLLTLCFDCLLVLTMKESARFQFIIVFLDALFLLLNICRSPVIREAK